MISFWIFLGVSSTIILVLVFLVYKMFQYDIDAEHRENLSELIKNKTRKN